MSITNGYATLDQFKAQMRIGVSDYEDDARMELAVAAASRQIDAHTGRRFWQDSTVKVREFICVDDDCVFVDDISTTVGLIVKTDSDTDGTYETTLTVDVDFKLAPWNAADETPVRPYEELRLMPLSSNYFPQNEDFPTFQVTAKFGWPAVPDDVTKACLVQAGLLFKADDASLGAIQFADAGVALRMQNRLHPVAEALLEPYCRARVG
tara:strand:- start:1214 stop:1840 length:627 start_codon:yes stop_codon:yes gene_type:complete